MNNLVGKRRAVIILKFLLLIVFLLYLKFRIDPDIFIYNLEQFISNLSSSRELGLFFIAVVLVPVNWFLEAYKWQLLMPRINRYNIFNSLKTIIVGLAAGLFTPFRLGEYIGRLNNVKKSHFSHSILSSIIGSIGQWFGAFIVGVSAYYFIYDTFKEDQWIHFVLVGGTILIASVYFNIPYFLKLFSRIKWLKKFNLKNRYEYLKNYSFPYGSILITSILRFLLFSFQYSICVSILRSSELDVVELSRSSFMFLMQRFIPLPSFFGIPIRSEMSLWIWNVSEAYLELFTLASLIVWTLNILIPSIVGLVIILLTKYD